MIHIEDSKGIKIGIIKFEDLPSAIESQTKTGFYQSDMLVCGGDRFIRETAVALMTSSFISDQVERGVMTTKSPAYKTMPPIPKDAANDIIIMTKIVELENQVKFLKQMNDKIDLDGSDGRHLYVFLITLERVDTESGFTQHNSSMGIIRSSSEPGVNAEVSKLAQGQAKKEGATVKGIQVTKVLPEQVNDIDQIKFKRK
jgi:hypothetical protein